MQATKKTFLEDFETLQERIENLKHLATPSQISDLLANFKALHLQAKKLIKIKHEKPRKLVNVSDEMLDFIANYMPETEREEYSRSDIIKSISSYIKKQGLAEGIYISFDEILKLLLNVENLQLDHNGKRWSYLSINKLITPHVAKK